ncbi:hypothetical protein VTL71DRAFT_6353 [Oculimacula yallundae]|uniref:Kinesin light chain n=1 Tax=Oculimacula yallundae TaxID=86028 RepID=A0ABR4BXM2_9HELO
MRLLKLNGDGFSLVDVPTHNDRNYAILSHTWTPGQEVTYEELLSGGGKDKSGYEKIRFCGKQALQDGLLYFWVDTCCIDKSDSVELSTAINSMFRWYRNARKCYVYLADVSIPDHDTDTTVEQSTWEAAFRASKWFTRGWTLQELIAPSTVDFFSKEGERLGDKHSLQQVINEITQIPIEALQGNAFSDFSIADRQNWAAQRQTTQEEDLVYCLMGLCEVSMPAIYGEGRENAWKRFHMTVKGFSKPNELQNPEQTSISFIVPFDRNPHFTGRESQLAKLEERLIEQGHTTKVAVTGLGGVGKTQVALEFVYRVKDRHPNCSVIWLPATNLESLHQAYRDVARQLCIPGWEEKESDAKTLVQNHLSHESSGQWLLVIDNADDIDLWFAKTAGQGNNRLVDYLPRSKHGCIIFTTRDRKTAIKLAQKNVVDVREMDKDAATQLLRNALINPDLVQNEVDTMALLQELTYLPLAIAQAAAYINENEIAFSDYLVLLGKQEEDVIELLSKDFEDEGRYNELKDPVATTWLISFEQIRSRDPLAADYLSFMACIDAKNIQQSLLPKGRSRKQETDAIGTLSAYSFISKLSTNQAFDLHRLVHLATRNWLRRRGLITEWSEKAITRLEEVFPDDDHEKRSVWRLYFPHVQIVLDSGDVDKEGSDRMKLRWRYGGCLFSDGRYNEAEVQFVEAFEANKKLLGQEHPDTLTSMACLAMIYRNQGRWKEAEDLGGVVMETPNLAVIYRNQGRWKEAEDLGVAVIETRKRVLGQEHPHTLTSIANLASIYWHQGLWKAAEELDITVIETQKRVIGQEHPDTITSMANLASTYWNQGRWREAEELGTVVLETQKRVLGQEHPDTLISMANLASTYGNQGLWKEAEELDIAVLETRKRILGQRHPDTLTSMANMASTYRNQCRWREAEDLQVVVLEMRKRILGQRHPDTLLSMWNLAFIWNSTDRQPQALEMLEHCARLQVSVLGADHPDTLSVQKQLLKWRTDTGAV